MREWLPLGRTRWFSAELYVHVSVVVAAGLLVLLAPSSPLFAFLVLASLITLILLHEFGHAAVAHHFGHEVRSIWFSLIHGRCEFDTPEDPWERSLIAWGGVMAQLLLALPLILLDKVLHHSVGVLAPVVLILGYWSVIVAVMNLVPVRGFDGANAWKILPMLRQHVASRHVVRKAIRRNRERR